MKPQLLKLPTHSDCSFNLSVQYGTYFPTPWHYHPEYEIVLMLSSTGKKFIGNSITDFKEGDLCLIGSFLPHYYRNDVEYYEPNSTLIANSLVIHFREDFLGENFWQLPEGQHIKELLNRSKKGLQINGETQIEVAPKIKRLFELEGMDRLLEFISILNIFSKSKHTMELSSSAMVMQNATDSSRMNKVFEHVMQHYQVNIRLDEVAQLASMSESAFSRYFKKRTRRTFSEFLAEIRIEHACKLLIESNYSVAEVSYESGFNNLSNFNRQFKEAKNLTPLAFRNKFLKQ
jgi:AraC-like DNA-binding protein